jgi:hypothetical protein
MAAACNSQKANKDPEAWLIEKLGSRKAKAKLRAIRAYFATMQTFMTEQEDIEKGDVCK